ncbi:MAG: M14 family metallocarboxypeptidase [Myxococcota bacterium]|nr:M14 family metallocarboxypeptidase [Myxococcota bacterium]MEC8425578.1 M14 family metallocarboxypeptidase [Myxococcota bacterium]
MEHRPYDIGTPGSPWGMSERKAWLDRQQKQRDFYTDVERPVRQLNGRFQIVQYGNVDYGVGSWPLLGLRTRRWNPDRPTALITGGVHGYETSGVHGALRFVQAYAHAHESRWNLLVAPCVSPWGYETINRWNPDAVDPNRSFLAARPAQEAGLLMDWIADEALAPRLHIDLHETTDTDNTEFRPALAARDGVLPQRGPIPDGFYTVGPSAQPALDFQSAVISSVERVTHIADPDSEGRIIGVPVSRPGVILYDARPLGLCMGMTSAPFATTTEVYPDSPRTSPETCVVAQVAAIEGALTHAANRGHATA